jgi:hypothetical protein
VTDGGGDIVATSPSSKLSLLHAAQPMIQIGTHLVDTAGTGEGETRRVAVDFALGSRSSDGRRSWVGRGKWAVAKLNRGASVCALVARKVYNLDSMSLKIGTHLARLWGCALGR